MNWDQVEGQWSKVKGTVKSKWAKLTDDDLKNLSGKKDQLVGIIQKRYGVVKDEAEKQVNEWIAKIDTKLGHATDKASDAASKVGDKVSGVARGDANAKAKQHD